MEERVQLVPRDEVHSVIRIDVPSAWNDDEYLGLAGKPVRLYAEFLGMRLVASDEQHRTGRNRLDVIIHRKRWPGRAEVELGTLKWVDWYNHRRLLEPIGNIPPAEAEANYWPQLSELPMAA